MLVLIVVSAMVTCTYPPTYRYLFPMHIHDHMTTYIHTYTRMHTYVRRIIVRACVRACVQVVNGGPSLDLFGADITRFHPTCTATPRWLQERSHETYANQSVIPWPHDQPLAGRTAVRRSALNQSIDQSIDRSINRFTRLPPCILLCI